MQCLLFCINQIAESSLVSNLVLASTWRDRSSHGLVVKVKNFQPFRKIIHSQFLVIKCTNTLLPRNATQRNLYCGSREDTFENVLCSVLWKWKVEDTWDPQSWMAQYKAVVAYYEIIPNTLDKQTRCTYIGLNIGWKMYATEWDLVIHVNWRKHI